MAFVETQSGEHKWAIYDAHRAHQGFRRTKTTAAEFAQSLPGSPADARRQPSLNPLRPVPSIRLPSKVSPARRGVGPQPIRVSRLAGEA